MDEGSLSVKEFFGLGRENKRKFIHWLHVGGIKKLVSSESKQWQNLSQYVKEHPESKLTVYVKTTGDMFCKIIRVECEQNYNDLDLDCNSMFDGSIRCLNRKPNNIELCKEDVNYFLLREGLS